MILPRLEDDPQSEDRYMQDMSIVDGWRKSFVRLCIMVRTESFYLFFPDTLPIPSSPTPSLEEEDQLDPQWLLSSSSPIRQPLIEMMGNMSPFALRW